MGKPTKNLQKDDGKSPFLMCNSTVNHHFQQLLYKDGCEIGMNNLFSIILFEDILQLI